MNKVVNFEGLLVPSAFGEKEREIGQKSKVFIVATTAVQIVGGNELVEPLSRKAVQVCIEEFLEDGMQPEAKVKVEKAVEHPLLAENLKCVGDKRRRICHRGNVLSRLHEAG